MDVKGLGIGRAALGARFHTCTPWHRTPRWCAPGASVLPLASYLIEVYTKLGGVEDPRRAREVPKLCFEERLDLTLQLRELFGVVQELEPVMAFA